MGTIWFGKEDSSANSDGERRRAEESRYQFRRLKHMMGDGELFRVERNGTTHKIRHKKKLKKTSNRIGNNDGPSATHPSKHSVSLADYVSNKNQSVIVRSSNNNTVNYYSDVIVKEKVDLHEHCYTTNEVLEIIAVTCLVNFIFWFLIISCVNFYTKKEKAKYPSWESLESAGITSEYELSQHLRHARDKEEMSRSPAEDYVYEEEEELENNCLISCDVPMQQKLDVYVGSCKDVKWTIFGNREGKQFVADRQKRRKSLISSHSMENLIF